MDARRGCFQESGNSFINQSRRWKGSPTPQGEAAIVGSVAVPGCTAVMYLFTGHSNICRIQFLRFGEPVNRPCVCRASVFTATADLLAAEEISLWMAYSFIAADSRGERADSPAIALKAEPSDRAEEALPPLRTDSLLALSCRGDFKPRWFQHFEYEDGVLSPSLCSPPHLPHLRKPLLSARGLWVL